MPYYRYQIQTSLTPDVVMRQLQSVTGEEKGKGIWQGFLDAFSFEEPDYPFLGKVEGYAFNIHRNIRYRNSCLPDIRGRVEPSSTGSTIFITMTLDPLVAFLMFFWLLLTGPIGWYFLIESQTQGAGLLIPFFVLGIILVLAGFYPEAFTARDLLNKIINNASA